MQKKLFVVLDSKIGALINENIRTTACTYTYADDAFKIGYKIGGDNFNLTLQFKLRLQNQLHINQYTLCWDLSSGGLILIVCNEFLIKIYLVHSSTAKFTKR